MNKHRLLGAGLLFLIVAFIIIQPAYVGPGSKIAKALIATIWGSISFIGLAIVCLSLSVYEYIWGQIEEKRPLKESF